MRQEPSEIAKLIRNAKAKQSCGGDKAISILSEVKMLLDIIPDEIYRNHVFPFIPIELLASRCSLVNKRWNSNVKYSRVSIDSSNWGLKKLESFFEIVKSFSCIETLNMRDNYGEDEDYSLIQYISENLIELKKLHIRGSLSNQGHVVTNYLTNGKLYNLEELSLVDYKLEERGVQHLLKQESCLKKLKTLIIGDRNMEDYAVRFSEMKHLKSLTLSGCNLTEKDVETLCKNLTNLEEFSLMFCNISADPKCLEHVANYLTNLKSLQIFVLHSQSAKYLSSGILKNLKKLVVSNIYAKGDLENLFSGNLQINSLTLNCFQEGSLKAIGKGNTSSLKELHLAGGMLSTPIQDLAEGRFKLEKLKMKKTSVGLEELSYFNSPVFSSLKVLDLDYCIGFNLEILKHCNFYMLRVLIAKWTGLEDTDMQILKECVDKDEKQLGNLTHLDLIDNRIGDEGCKYLSECKGLYQLRKLKIMKGNLFGSEGTNHLVEFALNRPNLTYLHKYSLLESDDY